MSLYFIKETAYAGSVLYIFGQLDGHLKWNFINLTGSTAMPCVKLFETTPFSFFANKVVNKNSDTINSKYRLFFFLMFFYESLLTISSLRIFTKYLLELTITKDTLKVFS